MRLLDTQTLKLHEFYREAIPPYVILSHTWSTQEVTYDDLIYGRGPSRESWEKVLGCCRKAAANGYDYAWIDTCCIDKSSSAELSEAINSMYQWYRNADFCYVYLEDMSQLLATRTEARLQQLCHKRSQFQLLAPPIVHIFDRSWKFIGSRTELRGLIADITGIDHMFFDTGDLSQYSIAQKMSWASGRQTTRIEDQAYCLLGIFGITMPLLYGEGSEAFRRLQEEIVKRTDMDHSIFAHSFYNYRILARRPSDFRNYGDVGFLDLKRLPQLRNIRRKDVEDHDDSSVPEVVVVELIQEDPCQFRI
ncbi:heterokaryon incompatibility protein-domain-containing protein [Tricladium varicosporioides]|nr:heterokaryon incompatibility protein-domain-containing protein [Hymenoscyphus varicosporioides]